MSINDKTMKQRKEEFVQHFLVARTLQKLPNGVVTLRSLHTIKATD